MKLFRRRTRHTHNYDVFIGIFGGPRHDEYRSPDMYVYECNIKGCKKTKAEYTERVNKA